MQAQTGGGANAPSHSQPGTRRRWVVTTMLRPIYPWERLGTHCTGGWVGLGASLDGHEKSRPPPGFGPGTVRPVAIHCTDYTIPATIPTKYIPEKLMLSGEMPCVPLNGIMTPLPRLSRLVAGLSSRRPGFDPKPVHVGFLVDKVAFGQVFPRVLRFSHVNFIPPVLHYTEKRKT